MRESPLLNAPAKLVEEPTLEVVCATASASALLVGLRRLGRRSTPVIGIVAIVMLTAQGSYYVLLCVCERARAQGE